MKQVHYNRRRAVKSRRKWRLQRGERQFAQWVGVVEREIASDVEAEAWRTYFQAGLSPTEAIQQSRRGA